jgi:sterol desaturase/sphingolipid hydroxylase (fatty acid hydroxylase superfamily)
MLDIIFNFFNHLEQHPEQRFAMLMGGLLFFWILEGAIPLLTLTYKQNKAKHALVNLTFTIFHLIIHSILAFGIIKISDWSVHNNFGLLQWLNFGIFGKIVISFFALDFFMGWLVHWVEHKVPILWRFHVVHHADNNVDATTGLRHHPIESLVRGAFIITGIFLVGAPMYCVMIYQTILIFATAFTHANISLPKGLDKALSFFFVSPNMHKVHHHYKQPFTDSNYGAVLSIWDRLFGTFMQLAPNNIKYGLDRYYPNSQDENFVGLMTKPFGKMENKIVE